MTAKVVSFRDERERRIDQGVREVVQRRWNGSYRLDAWGLDSDAVRFIAKWSGLRWGIHVSGIENLPVDGPALLVANRRLGWSEPMVTALGILRDTGRIVRPVGSGDLDPAGGFLRRFGAIPARADEISAALRARQVVLVPTRRTLDRFASGNIPIELIEPAVTYGVPVIPVAVIGREIGRNWRIDIGAPVSALREVGPRAVGHCGVEVSQALTQLLDASRADIAPNASVRHEIEEFGDA